MRAMPFDILRHYDIRLMPLSFRLIRRLFAIIYVRFSYLSARFIMTMPISISSSFALMLMPALLRRYFHLIRR